MKVVLFREWLQPRRVRFIRCYIIIHVSGAKYKQQFKNRDEFGMPIHYKKQTHTHTHHTLLKKVFKICFTINT